MKKLWSHLCFLVLAVSSVSRGEDVTTPTPTTEVPDVNSDSPTSMNTTQFTPTMDEAGNHTSPNVTTPFETNSTAEKETGHENGTEGYERNTSSPTTALTEEPEIATTTMMVTTSAASALHNQVTIEGGGSRSWGYVILVFIILVIIVLCVILFYLRKVSRSYSFDLHRPTPASHDNEPIGTFEPVYLDDLDQTAPTDNVSNGDDSPPPVANGTTLQSQSEEKESSGESATQEQQEANGLETLSVSNGSPSAENPLELGSNTVFFDAVGEEQQNENNNNPSVCSSDPFVEINLDGPAWSDQLLTSPEVPSSVLPFSPFTFSPSS